MFRQPLKPLKRQKTGPAVLEFQKAFDAKAVLVNFLANDFTDFLKKLINLVDDIPE